MENNINKENPFKVPDQYFEGLSDRISAAVFVEDLKSKAGFFEADVPEGYFENLSDEINTRITLESLNLPKADGFTVPQGYFDKLQGNILSKVTESPAPAKVVKLWPARFAKYAAAASLILVSAFAIYFNQDKLFRTSESVVKVSASPEDSALWDIDEQTIRDHMDIDIDDKEQITNTSASSTELEDYIISHYSQNEIATTL